MTREKIIDAILICVWILTVSVILFLTKSNIFKEKEETIEEVKINDGYQIYEVENLEKKFNKLSFVNKKQDFYNKTTKYTINTNITSGKVNVSIKFDDIKRVYEIDNISNAKSIHTNVDTTGDGVHITYILTEDKKVYKVEDNLKEVKEKEDYKGNAEDLGLTNVDSIAIDKNLKFKINDGLETIVPCVYIKTDDGRYFTDEKIIEGKNIVELVEKKTEVIENNNETTK